MKITNKYELFFLMFCLAPPVYKLLGGVEGPVEAPVVYLCSYTADS